jgi:hypothetical protein
MYAHGVQAPTGIDPAKRPNDLPSRWNSQPVRDGGHHCKLTETGSNPARCYKIQYKDFSAFRSVLRCVVRFGLSVYIALFFLSLCIKLKKN